MDAPSVAGAGASRAGSRLATMVGVDIALGWPFAAMLLARGPVRNDLGDTRHDLVVLLRDWIITAVHAAFDFMGVVVMPAFLARGH